MRDRAIMASIEAGLSRGTVRSVTDAKGDPIESLVKSRKRELAAPVAERKSNVVPRNVVPAFTLIVRLDVPSVNKATGSLATWMNIKKRVKLAVLAAWLSADRPIILTPWRHTVTFMGARRRDPMNRAWVLWKPGVDALCDLRALPGDSTKWDHGGSYGFEYRADVACAKWEFVGVAGGF